jgi:UDP-N-acetylglucosamine 4,6-dehydratase
MFDGKKILITGGTGSLGSALTERLLKTDVDTIRIFSRDEWKQTNLENRLNDKRLRFFIGDVRDKERLYRALEGDIDIVIHAAALKQVPVAEYNPFEAVKTNVYGAQNLIEACLDKNVKMALAVGTDKAVSPLNTYGATKLLMEKLFIASNYYGGPHITKFFCVRYGNVLGSRGSVVPLFIEKIRKGEQITVTDPSMTRFNITMGNALDLIFRALEKGKGRETFVPKLKAYKLGDMKDAIIELLDGKNEIEKVPIRPGEKFHESLINIHEIRDTYDDGEDYVLFDKQSKFLRKEDIPDIKKADLNTEYSSDKVELLSVEEIKKILLNEKIIQN